MFSLFKSPAIIILVLGKVDRTCSHECVRNSTRSSGLYIWSGGWYIVNRKNRKLNFQL